MPASHLLHVRSRVDDDQPTLLSSAQAAAESTATDNTMPHASLAAAHANVKSEEDRITALEEELSTISAAAAEAERLSAKVDSPQIM